DLFLWQPSDIPEETEVTVSFALPPGLWVTTPWIPLPAAGAPAGASARFRIPPSAFEWQAMMTFARTAPEMLPVRGATLTVARLDRPVQASSEGVRRWLREAAAAVSGLYGTFPIERAQVIVHPVSGDAIEFGYVQRGGGATVLFLLGDEAEDENLVGEW